MKICRCLYQNGGIIPNGRKNFKADSGKTPSRQTAAGLVYWGNDANVLKGDQNEQTI